MIYLSTHQGSFSEPVNKPHRGDLLKADSCTPSASVPASRGDILSHAIQRLVLFQDQRSATLPPNLFMRCCWEKHSRDQPSQVFQRPLEQITGILLPARWNRPGEGRRGQGGAQGSAWDKKTRPHWAPLHRSVCLAPQTGRPTSMNGSLDGTSETLSHNCNFSLFFFLKAHLPPVCCCFSLSIDVGRTSPT